MGNVLNVKQWFQTKNRCYKKWKKITPIGIVVHSTGANNPYIKRYVGPDDGLLGENTNNNHWNNEKADKCMHGFIGKLQDGSIACYQTLPWDHRCWGCGAGDKGSYNSSHIQFEICEDNLKNAAYYKAAFSMAAELCAYLCEVYKIPVENIVGHYEAHKLGYASNHSDPEEWMKKHGDDMDQFRKRVAMLIGDIQFEEDEVEIMGTYRVKGGKLALRRAAVIDNSNLICYMPNGSVIEIIENDNTWACVKYNGTKGYCMVKYLEKVQDGKIVLSLEAETAKALLTALSDAGIS